MDKHAQDHWVSALSRIKRASLTNGLHGVPLLNEQLSSGDVDVHPQGLLLLVDCVGCTSVFTEEVSENRNEQRPVVPPEHPPL